MKKGDIIQLYIEEAKYPCTGIGYIDGQRVLVDDCFQGQGVEAQIYKKKNRQVLAKKLSLIKHSEDEQEAICPHDEKCGGCCFQTLRYDRQLALKGKEVLNHLKSNNIRYETFLGVEGSVNQLAYRNKMEYTFGDEVQGGEITLGMHKKNQFMSVITVDECKLVSDDFNLILSETLWFCKEKGYPFYHKKSHQGLMRNLIIRKGEKTGEIFVNIVTSSQGQWDKEAYIQLLLSLSRDTGEAEKTGEAATGLDGKLVGIAHTLNDNMADAVNPEQVDILWGQGHFYDEIMGLTFQISPFSFFQTNTLTAERLYAEVLAFLGDVEGKTILELYSGTGTISQIMALKAKEVIAVEIVEEAVAVARENAKRNGLGNCRFIAGDAGEVMDAHKISPDVIVVDPPRVGILPKAMEKILRNEASQIIYISCNPQSLGTNLAVMQEAGYVVQKVKVFDQFPYTRHVETVVLMSRNDG